MRALENSIEAESCAKPSLYIKGSDPQARAVLLREQRLSQSQSPKPISNSYITFSHSSTLNLTEKKHRESESEREREKKRRVVWRDEMAGSWRARGTLVVL